MRLLPGTPLHYWIHPTLKGLKKFMPYATADFLRAFVVVTVKG
jgi:hypothetical protein